MAGRFATTTDVEVDQTRKEIEQLVLKYGATAYGDLWDAERNAAVITFRIAARQVRIILPLPDLEARELSRGTDGRKLTEKQVTARREQAPRSAWRALHLVIKANLEAVERGIMTLETAFLPHIVLPNGQTMIERYAPQIKVAYETCEMPALLPGLEQKALPG
jgi:hypothetical protein